MNYKNVENQLIFLRAVVTLGIHSVVFYEIDLNL